MILTPKRPGSDELALLEARSHLSSASDARSQLKRDFPAALVRSLDKWPQSRPNTGQNNIHNVQMFTLELS